MDAAHVDALSRALARTGSRRGVIGGPALGAFGLLAWTGARDATAKQCNKIKNAKKRKQCKRRKTPRPAAFGCTADDDSCSEGAVGRPCPDKPEGVCNVTIDGFPMCTQDVSPLCVTCGRHDTCQNLLGAKSARCIRCPDCFEGFDRACYRAA